MSQTPPGPPAPGPGQPSWPAAAPLPEHPEATKALVLGLVSLIGGLTCWLPIVLGPWAWVVGRRAVSEIDAEPERWSGRSTANAGYVLGVVASVLLGTAVAVVVGFLVFFVVVFYMLEAQTTPMF